MLDCKSQSLLCPVPIRFDTYKGCSHGCSYCFVSKKRDISQVEKDNCLKALELFLQGKRTRGTNWADWDIPLHFGGVSDPLQPIELKERLTLKSFELFAKYNYPFILSTKAPQMLLRAEYKEVLKKCNCVLQISAVSPKNDKIEPNCIPYKKRIEIAGEISKADIVKRIIIRAQPYLPVFLDDILEWLPKMKENGVYGIILEGMKHLRAVEGFEKNGGDYCIPLKTLLKDFVKIKAKCTELGLQFLSGENRTRALGHSLNCCGFEGLEGFKGNDYNLIHLANMKGVRATKAQSQKGTAECFSGIYQDSLWSKEIKNKSFKELIDLALNLGAKKCQD